MANEFGPISVEEMIQASMMGKDIPWESPEGDVDVPPQIAIDALSKSIDPKSPWSMKVDPWGKLSIDMNPENAGVVKPETTKQPGTEPTQPNTKPTSPSSVSNQVGFGPALSALVGPTGGPSASDLAGLTVDQIMAIMGQSNQARQLEQKTISQLMNLPYLQAKTEEALRPPIAKPEETTILDFWKDGVKQRKMIPKSGFNKAARSVLASGGTLEKPGDPKLWEINTPLDAYDNLMSTLFRKTITGGQKLVDVPDESAIEAIHQSLLPRGYSIMKIPAEKMNKVKRSSWKTGIPGVDWLGDILSEDLKPRDMYVILKSGAKLTRPDFIRTAVGVYGLSTEEAEKLAEELIK